MTFNINSLFVPPDEIDALRFENEDLKWEMEIYLNRVVMFEARQAMKILIEKRKRKERE